jgi:hypothetical protein
VALHPRREPRRKKGEASREKVQEAIESAGAAGVTLAALVDAIGFSNATFQRHASALAKQGFAHLNPGAGKNPGVYVSKTATA